MQTVKLDATLLEISNSLGDAIRQLRTLIEELEESEYKMLRDKLEKKAGKLERIHLFIRDINGT